MCVRVGACGASGVYRVFTCVFTICGHVGPRGSGTSGVNAAEPDVFNSC